MDALIADLLPYQSGIQVEGISGEFNTLTAMPALSKQRDWTAIAASVIVGGVIAALIALLAGTAYLGFTTRTSPELDDPSVRVPEQASQNTAVPVQEVAPVETVGPEPVEAPAVTPVQEPVKPRQTRRTVRPTPPAAVTPEPIEVADPVADPVPAPKQPASNPKSPPPSPPSDWADEDLEAGDDDWQ